MIASAGNLSILRADLNLSSVTVLSTAIPHTIGLAPDQTVVTEWSPGAGLRVGILGWTSRVFTSGLHGPVLLPGVSPVHVVFPVWGQRLWTLASLSIEDASPVLTYVGPNHPEAFRGQIEQVIVSIGLTVDSMSGAGLATEDVLAQPLALVEVSHASRLQNQGVTTRLDIFFQTISLADEH